MDDDLGDKIAEFVSITGGSAEEAIEYLSNTGGNLQEAVSAFFDGPDETAESTASPSTTDHMADEQPSSSSRGGRAPQQGRLRTIRDLQGGGGADSDDDSDDNRQDFFAGGEKSGLAVQNPNNNSNPDHFNNIMNQARQQAPRPGGDDEPTRPSHFTGRAQTLGGDDAPSRLVEDPQDHSQRPSSLPRVTRTLHLWQDGFSVDDGPLFRFDDPANAPTLALINQGRAPLALLGVEPGQEVDLNLSPHKDEKFVQPKKKWKAFEGSGQRLGSPTPGPSGPSTAPAAPAAAPVSSAPAPSTGVQLDPSQPTIMLQIRLGDGTRVSSRFNPTHTMGDVYALADASSAEGRGRNYVLMTTFPNKQYGDKSVALGDLPEFARGGMVIQKWI